ncbi:hypothetical protein R103_M20586 [Saccharomyces cerevisiae R103]|nr:hypothetical protein R008_M11621 [Saccharomyces cerevisiae R008]EWG94025.1 hypothetical protein R103_M20586 [Saccharomyces cerevisiae R103]
MYVRRFYSDWFSGFSMFKNFNSSSFGLDSIIFFKYNRCFISSLEKSLNCIESSSFGTTTLVSSFKSHNFLKLLLLEADLLLLLLSLLLTWKYINEAMSLTILSSLLPFWDPFDTNLSIKLS